ncbi:hypothetical protein [Tepidibacter aestuarii]|uniref:hypothetical protein n=1 Tax=Tepidibacter aestuarii TaxID=2925782 RepID=UPI0020BD7ED3|nr:hypothetical protein [Tepidibacter aestuarii]CAH2215306.1 conserved membrane protein of unknown function [Tepidibacter aestuarii]
MIKKDRSSRFLTISFSIIMILVVIGFLIKKEYNFIYNSIMIYVSYLFIIYFENKNKKMIKSYIKALVIIAYILHNVVGQYFNLYQNSIWFDKALHIFGTFAFSLLFYSMLDLSIKFFSESKIFIFIILMSIGVTGGAFLESGEFILDIIMNTKNQHGLLDTNLDLIFNAFGAVLAGILGAFNEKYISNK